MPQNSSSPRIQFRLATWLFMTFVAAVALWLNVFIWEEGNRRFNGVAAMVILSVCFIAATGCIFERVLQALEDRRKKP